MKTQRVTLITLGVDDLDRAQAFYAALGWVSDDSSPQVVFYSMDGMKLGLFSRTALAEDQGRPGETLGTGAITLAQNFPDRASVDAAFAQAESAGAKVLIRPRDVFWGGYSGYFADPDGHVWELAHNPFWNLDANGALIPNDQDQS